MKYIELLSKSKYGRLNIRHSILQDWDTILSFENGVFKIYSRDYLTDRIIKKVIDIPDFDLKQYKGRKEEDYLCYEAIDLIAKENWIQMDTILKRSKRITRWIILLLITHWIMFAWWYYGFTMSEEEFLLYKQDVCQE
jgi:hypothetical protein